MKRRRRRMLTFTPAGAQLARANCSWTNPGGGSWCISEEGFTSHCWGQIQLQPPKIQDSLLLSGRERTPLPKSPRFCELLPHSFQISHRAVCLSSMSLHLLSYLLKKSSGRTSERGGGVGAGLGVPVRGRWRAPDPTWPRAKEREAKDARRWCQPTWVSSGWGWGGAACGSEEDESVRKEKHHVESRDSKFGASNGREDDEKKPKGSDVTVETRGAEDARSQVSVILRHRHGPGSARCSHPLMWLHLHSCFFFSSLFICFVSASRAWRRRLQPSDISLNMEKGIIRALTLHALEQEGNTATPEWTGGDVPPEPLSCLVRVRK